MIILRSIYQNHLMFNFICGHVEKVAVRDLMLKYGGGTTVDANEKAAICGRCMGNNITNTQIIYVGSSELAMHSSHTPNTTITFYANSN